MKYTMTKDIISDMFVRVRDGSVKKLGSTSVLYCNFNIEVLKILVAEGYFEKVHVFTSPKKEKKIKIFFKYEGEWVKQPTFTIFVRVSRPGMHLFSKYEDFSKKVNLLKHSNGTAIISTSSGLMTHKKAISLKKGGEIICYIG